MIKIAYNDSLQELQNLALTFGKLQSLFRKPISVLGRHKIVVQRNWKNAKGTRNKRAKRSVVSTIYNWLFRGGLDDKVTRHLKNNIKKLFENDQMFSEQLNRSLALINMNRDEIRVNRQLIQGLRKVAEKMLEGMQTLEAELVVAISVTKSHHETLPCEA